MYDPTPSFSNLLILSQISHWKLNINQSDTFLLANINLFLVKALFLYKERFGIKYLVIYLFPLLGFFRKWAKFAIQICNQSESIQNTALFGIFNVLIAVWNLSHVCESVFSQKAWWFQQLWCYLSRLWRVSILSAFTFLCPTREFKIKKGLCVNVFVKCYYKTDLTVRF